MEHPTLAQDLVTICGTSAVFLRRTGPLGFGSFGRPVFDGFWMPIFGQLIIAKKHGKRVSVHHLK